ncbi:MAG: creatininase family protein [Nitrososphaerales archaeon]
MFIEEITSDKASKIIGKIDTLILPVGTVEAHGPHCSVASDIIVPVRMGQEVEKLAGDRVLIAPIIPYGHTWHLKDYPGSHDIPGEILSKYVFEVLKGFHESWKVKYAIILNGHGGNDHPLAIAAERAASIGLKTIVLDWWSGGFLAALNKFVPDMGGHAGEGETSLVWNVGEKYLDTKIIPKEDHLRGKNDSIADFSAIFDPNFTASVLPNAYAGRPSRASVEKGHLLNEQAARLIVELVDKFRSGRWDDHGVGTVHLL